MEVEYWREQHAFQKGYIGVIDSQLAPDYSAVLDTGQKVTRVQVLTMDRQTMDLFGRELRMTVHIDSLTGSDSKVEVLVTETVSGTVMNRDGRTQSLTSSDLSKDLWVHVGSLWKLKRSRLVKSTALIDGRPIRTAKK